MKNSKEKNLNNKLYYEKESVNNLEEKNSSGITLVALVVTIIVLLILAGVSLSAVFGQNGIFSRAEKSSTMSEIARYKEMLEMAKNPILIDEMGYINPDKYWEEIEKQKIINNRTKDIVDNGDGTYEVTTKPGYVFEIELIPSREKTREMKVEYIGENGKLPPKIKNITVTERTSTSLKIAVDVIRLEDGDINYYYKEEGKQDYKILKENVKDLTATIENLEDGKIYSIKVVGKNKNGKNELIVKEAIYQLVKSITLDKTEITIKKGEKLQLVANILPDNAKHKTLEWKSINENIATVDSNGLVSAKADGDTIIVVKSTDGSDIEKSCNIKVATLVTEIKLKPNSIIMQTGETTQLEVEVYPEDATDKTIIWTSSNSAIVNVDENGQITALKQGAATITVTSSNGIKATCNISIPLSVKDLKSDSLGKKVTGYRTSEEWEIFYVDSDHVYLISTAPIRIGGLSTTPNYDDGSGYTYYGGSSDFKDVTKLAYFPAVQAGFFRYSDNNSKSNMKAAQWMLDKRNWSNWMNTDFADWVIGAPTQELLSKSYTQLSGDTGSFAGKLTSNEDGRNPWNHGVSYWLASPGGEHSGDVAIMNTATSGMSIVNSGSYGFRAVVCLKSDVRFIKTELGYSIIK